MKNNPVFQVLVVSQTTAAAAGAALDALTVGQLGVFNAETNLAVDPNGVLPDKFYFAVGIPNTSGTLGDIRKSTGEYIKKALINTIYTQTANTPSDGVTTLDLTGFTPAASKEYVIRFNFMSAETMGMQGFNHPVKSFVISTTTVAPSLSAFLDLIVTEVNNDVEQLVVAAKVGDTVTFTVAADDKVTALAGLNPKYHFLRQYVVKTSIGGDFLPENYTLTVVDPVYEQGAAYDIAQWEYIAGGWNGNPGIFRESNLTSFIGYGTDIFAVAGTYYWTMRWNYEFFSHSGGNLPYYNQLETVIAIPQTDAYAALIAILVDMITAHNPTSGTIEIPATTTTTTAAVTTTTTTAAVTTTTTTSGT